MIKIPPEEIKRIRENLQRQKTFNKLLSETPEFKEQARIFMVWVSLAGVPEVKCPVCDKGKLAFSCGHGNVEGALKLARDMVEEHSKETKRVHEELEKRHPELQMIPLKGKKEIPIPELRKKRLNKPQYTMHNAEQTKTKEE